MLLTPQDVELFFTLHWTLMFFVNQRLKVVPDDIASRSGESYSRTWTNLASRSPSTGNFRRCSKLTEATCGRCEKPIREALNRAQ